MFQVRTTSKSLDAQQDVVHIASQYMRHLCVFVSIICKVLPVEERLWMFVCDSVRMYVVQSCRRLPLAPPCGGRVFQEGEVGCCPRRSIHRSDGSSAQNAPAACLPLAPASLYGLGTYNTHRDIIQRCVNLMKLFFE